MVIREIAEENLTKNGASIDTISKSRLAQFEKVDAAIQTCLSEARKEHDLLKTNPINVSTIVADTSIARKPSATTIYSVYMLMVLWVFNYSKIYDTRI